MKKIVLIGAGSSSFARQLLTAMFSYNNVKDSLFVLHDIDEKKLDFTYAFTQQLIQQEKTQAKVIKTLYLEEALEKADFVITAFTVGGMKAWKMDLEIPLKYGVDQDAGDTMGPGGMFRAMRDIPVLVNIAKKMETLCPQALLLNYSNPLAPMVKAVQTTTHINVVGLCYAVPYTVAQILGFLGEDKWISHPNENKKRHDIVNAKISSNVEFEFAGINHMTWITGLRLNGVDLYPRIRQLVDDEKVKKEDLVRLELLKTFDLFCTVNHWHLSDYLPYFKKNKQLTEKFLPVRWNLLSLEEEKIKLMTKQMENEIEGKVNIPVKQNIFNAPKIINAIINDEKTRVNININNDNFVPNLPAESIVEIPAYVDKQGIKPCKVTNLPNSCAALNKTNILFQELLVEGVLNKDLKLLKQALCFDPLTSAVCTLEEISSMFDEMYEAEKEFLKW
jgi:alpha-galactosidase